jgi:hypothetical protein
LILVDQVRLTHYIEYLPRRDGWILCVPHLPEQYHEFIAAEAAYGVRASYTRG